MLPIVAGIRNLKGPAGFDLCPIITIRTRTWTDGAKGLGYAIDKDLVLAHKYPVVQMKAAEIASSAGRYELGDIKVKYIDPWDGVGSGYTEEQLNPTVTKNGTEIIYLLSGRNDGEYQLVNGNFLPSFHYELVLRRRLTTP